MLVANRGGLPQGDTEDPVLIAQPRGGVPAVVDTPADLERAASRLRSGSAPVALDVERALGFRYGSDPYLVQIRREDVGSFLIDSHALPDLSPLNDGVGSTWLLHDCSQDLPNLRAVGLRCPELFDTEIAARLVGMRRFGLASVAESVLGLALVKDHQAADWSVRPLPKDWLRYAALDVELLTELYRRLSTRLHDLGRWEWAAQEFEHVRTKPARPAKVDPWRKTPRAGSSVRSPRSLAILRELWNSREQLAAELDRTPSKVLPHQALVAAAVARPRSRRKMSALKEFSSRQARQNQERWWRAIERALELPDDELPPTRAPLAPGELPHPRSWQRHHAAAAERLTEVRAAIRQHAEEIRVPQELLLTPECQRRLAWDLGAEIEAGRTGRVTVQEISERLAAMGARPWQIEQAAPALATALG